MTTTTKKTTTKKATAKRPASAKATTSAKAAPPAPTFEEISIKDVAANEHNVRSQIIDLAGLVDSIKEQGILEPLIVAPSGEAAGPRYVLIAGHRRLAAAKKARLQALPVIVRADLDTRAKQVEAMLVENLHRSDLTVIEEGNGYQLLLELGYTQTKVATATGRAIGTVRERLKLVQLPTGTQKKVAGGQLTIEHARALAEFVDDPATLKRLEKEAGGYNWNYYLRDARDKRTRAAAVDKLRGEIDKSGARYVDPDEIDAGKIGVFGVGYTEVNDLPEQVRAGHHATCTGHAVTVRVHPKPAKVELCTDLAQHPGWEGEDADDIAARAAEAERAAADERIRTALATSAKVRHEHLAEFIATASQEHAIGLLLDDTVKTAASNGTFGARLLGLDDDADRKAVRTAVEKLSLPSLVALRSILQRRYTDDSLLRPDGWGKDPSVSWSIDHAKAWRADLVEVYGYDWTPPEQGQLDEYAALAAAEADTTEGGGS